MKKQSGITLITLVATVILLLILIGTATTFSRRAIDDMKINQFGSELQVIERQLRHYC